LIDKTYLMRYENNDRLIRNDNKYGPSDIYYKSYPISLKMIKTRNENDDWLIIAYGPCFSRAKSEARWLVGGHLVPKVGHLTLFHASRMYRISSSCCEIGRLCGCCCCCPAAVAYRALLLLCAPTDGELPALWLLYPGELDAPATELLLWWWW